MSHSEENKKNHWENDIVVSRGIIEPGSQRSYKGVIFRNTFKVDRPVVLVGVSFCGVHEKYPAETNIPYQVSIRLQQSWSWIPRQYCWSWRRRQPPKFRNSRPTICSLLTKKGEKMRVDFHQTELLAPHVWYDIEFELDGPDTMHLNPASLQPQYSVENEGEIMLAMDSLNGSSQMTDFHFRFPTIDEIPISKFNRPKFLCGSKSNVE